MRPTARFVFRAFETLGSFTLTAACIVRAGSGHDLQLPENQDALVLRRSRESRGSRGVRQTGISPFRKRKDYLVEETPQFVSADPGGVGLKGTPWPGNTWSISGASASVWSRDSRKRLSSPR